MITRRLLLVIGAVLFSAARLPALEPAEVVLLVNRNMRESAAVAEHYRAKRGVPERNVVVLDLPTTEDMSRAEYDEQLVAPLREALKGRKDSVKVLLCIYGVPLRVGGKEPSASEREGLPKVQADLTAVRDRIKKLDARLKELEPEAKKDSASEAAREKAKLEGERKTAQGQERALDNMHRMLSWAESQASVDSELMLLWWDKYELRRFLPNPLHFQYPAERRKAQPPVLMTARLDGPTAEIARRLVDDAVEVEAKGLRGKVYVDARDNRYDPKSGDPGYGYAGYDESMREMAQLLKEPGGMDVVLDNKPDVFPPDSCPDSALYCGWYSHANFVDSNRFVKGAVAWHLSSSEAVSLRRTDTKFWCPRLLEHGAAATVGPVAEPYTVGFPKPAEFFGFLATGEYTLVECYSRSLNLTSWMCTLIGDPLYNPFKANPRLKSSRVQPSPKGGRFLLSTR